MLSKKNYPLKQDQNHFTINDLPDFDRPRERLAQWGEEALSSQELLSLVLGRGARGDSVLTVAQRLLSTFGSIQNIASASLEELKKVKGIGLAKAAQLKALFELARRSKTETKKKITVRKAQDAAHLLHPLFDGKKKEYFIILCLNAQHQLIRTSTISQGILNSNIVHPREIFKEAVQQLSAAIILAHNHPSGSPEPSAADRKITQQIKKAGDIFGIRVLDHLIIAGKGYFSFKEQGLF